MPVVSKDGFKGDPENTVSILKACEEIGVNLLTTRSLLSGDLSNVPLPFSVGEGLRRGVPRIL